MVYDLASNVRVAIQAQFGQVLLPYPLWVRALSTKASPVNAEIDAVLLPWTSSIDTTKARKGTVTALFVTSRAGGLQTTTALARPPAESGRGSPRPRALAAPPQPVAPPRRGRSRG